MIAFLRRHLNFAAFAAVMVPVAGGLTLMMDAAQSLLIGFDAGALVFMVLTAAMAGSSDGVQMRKRVAQNEPDHTWLSLFALIVVTVVLTSVWVELSNASGRRGAGVALGAVTLALAWLFANTLATLHYAHLWYSEKGGGVDFPGNLPNPDYWDFAYFAFTIGMTFQVSDAQITTRSIRRAALAHAIIAFFYNIAVVALSVSLIAAVLT